MENCTPLISVIVPVYKVEEYLAACVDSILAQTYENLEIILVDDGSPDNCGKICDSYAKKDSRIKVIHKENGGVSSARNAALDVINGEYVGFVDSDDTVRPEMFETLYKKIVENSADVAICKFDYCQNQTGDDFSDQSGETLIFEPEKAVANMLVGKYYAGQLCNKLFSTKLVGDSRLDTNIHVYEDLLLSVILMLKAKKICYFPKKLYNCHIRDGSAFRSAFNEKQLTAHDACLKIIEHIKSLGIYDTMKKYTDASVLLCNCTFMLRLYRCKEHRKKYSAFVRKNLRSYLNRESFRLLPDSTKVKCLLAVVSSNLYFASMRMMNKE